MKYLTAIRTDTTVTLTETAPFNQYTLTYSAAAPLRCELVYRIGDAVHTEEFFLDAGEDKRFSSYIDGYLRHETADAAVSLSLRTISHDEADFTLIDLAFDTVPVLAETTYFFENHRYRVGVELCWGGGLSYLADKACPVDELENLLNYYDTGRLIQQSYYGTGDPPYKCGEFMGNRWSYNPVQGGDRGNHKSKLIETRVGDHEVYVKCRPRDWGHDGGTTYAYMENWYRLDGDCVVVDNRFTDYSGWVHPTRGQEVPAFYTVSYLGNYHWYDGDAPWTDAPLSCKSDLPFWPTDWPYCTFVLKEENSETWSAFTNDAGYGLGLFTPGVRRLLAGRHAYDGSMDPRAGSCGYIAPIANLPIRCFEPIEYRYLLSAGDLSDIRARFKARRNDVTNDTFEAARAAGKKQ